MLTIISYTSEPLIDPFGILTGQRYEFFLDIEVPEDDELYSEKGLYIRVLYTIEETREGILKYDIHEKESEELLDFDLEEEEVKLLENFCKEHLS
ncbi:DUF6509 family protein [Peribacillus sp. B-H-3]|jgi:hypothetical protein|uniref:DUF6509 family protein n=1 Tax=Bacillaceae TaxID=186817 RepID=UPI0008F5763C|nr:DUF6509 family protein [Bacillus sp. MUM 13]OIK13230.1 pullulanase [Bacillus sp. MUM 13]